MTASPVAPAAPTRDLDARLREVAAAPPPGIADVLVGDSTLVVTEEMKTLVKHLRNIFKDGGRTIVVTGVPGLGKTTLLLAACALADVRVVLLSITGSLGDKGFWSRVAQALQLSTSGSAADIADRCFATLRKEPTVLVVDDAHNVDLRGLVRLRELKKNSGYRVGVVLCGNNLDNHLAKRKAIRVNRPVEMKSLTAAEMEPYLRQLHPLMKLFDLYILEWIDAEYCHGLWHEWTNFLGAVLEHLEERAEDDSFDPTNDFDAVEVAVAALNATRKQPILSRPKKPVSTTKKPAG